MGISMRNGEGYLDPTAEAGIRAAEKNGRYRMVYICSPYAGNTKVDTDGESDSNSIPKADKSGASNIAGNMEKDSRTANIARNVQNAIRYCRFAISKGAMPVASHLLYPQILDDKNPADRKLGLKFGIRLLKACREIWVFADDDSGISEGMWAEIDAARKEGKRIRYFAKDLRERI